MTSMARLRAIPSWQITLGVALLALGFLIAAQLASDGPRVRYTTQERTPLVETANELQAQQDELKARILELRSQIQGVEVQGEGSADLVRQLNTKLEQARVAAGLIALTGTGIVIQLDDSKAPVPPGGSESDYLVGSRDIRAPAGYRDAPRVRSGVRARGEAERVQDPLDVGSRHGHSE